MTRMIPFEIAQEQLEKVVKIIKLDPAFYEMLCRPMMELRVTIPVKMDDGSVKIFKGFRV